MKAWITTLLLILSGFVVGCETAEGVGQDVEKAGNAIENAANETEEEIDEEF